MYCNFYKNSEGREWYSISLENDEIGNETLTILKNTLKKNATEALNLDQFSKAATLVADVREVEDALRKGAAHDEEA